MDVMRQGTSVEVVSPPGLRRQVAEELRSTAAIGSCVVEDSAAMVILWCHRD
jgi:hypothetical protein